MRGIPPNYGCGAAEIVHGLVEQGGRARELMAEAEQAGRGDLDRLLIEWRSLLKQLVAAEALSNAECGVRSADWGVRNADWAEAGGDGAGNAEVRLREGSNRSDGSDRSDRSSFPKTERRNPKLALSARWEALRALARELLERMPRTTLPELPALTAEQRRPMNHRLMQSGLRSASLTPAGRGGR